MNPLYPYSGRPVFYSPSTLGNNPLVPNNIPSNTAATNLGNPLFNLRSGNNLGGADGNENSQSDVGDIADMSLGQQVEALGQMEMAEDVMGVAGLIGLPGIFSGLVSGSKAITQAMVDKSLAAKGIDFGGGVPGGTTAGDIAAAEDNATMGMTPGEAAATALGFATAAGDGAVGPSASGETGPGMSDAEMAATQAEHTNVSEADPNQGAGDAGDGGTVICSELRRQGLLPDHIWEADEEYGKTVSPDMRAGYLMWAEPWVQVMRSSEAATRFTHLLARPWAQHMAYEVGAESEDSTAGRIIMQVGGSICRLLGAAIRVFEIYRRKFLGDKPVLIKRS